MSDNPFRLETVIRVMAEEAEVNTLKEMREVTAKWNYFAVKELGEKASKLQMKPIDFSDEDNKYVESFLEATKSNPQFFQSFRFFYPGNFSSVEFFNWTDYTPKFIGQDFDGAFKFSVDDMKYLHEFFQIIGPNLEEFEIKALKMSEEGEEAPLSLTTMPGEQLMFPKLTKFSLKNYWNCGAETSKLISFFKFILDKSVAVDPAPNLTHLEIDSYIKHNFFKFMGLQFLEPNALSRWSRLTSLTLHTATEDSDEMTSTLLALGDAGMSLESLSVSIDGSNIMDHPVISTNFSNFFQTQAKSLKILILRCNFDGMEDATEEELIHSQILLPIFENLHTFKLKISMTNGDSPLAYRIFKLGPFPLHFPKLETLKTFNHQVLSIMFPEDTIPEPIPLRFLKVWIWSDEKYCRGWKDAFGDMIRSVETLKCQAMILEEGKKKIPWAESLRMLEIYEVKSPLKLRYLKNLQELTVVERFLPRLKKYLRKFDQVRSLKLSAITFKFKSGEISKNDKAMIIKYFPFTVNFTKI